MTKTITLRSLRSAPSKIAYRDLLAQCARRPGGESKGIDEEYIACHYLIAEHDFKWALRWSDLGSDFKWARVERGIDVVAEDIYGDIWAIQVKSYRGTVKDTAYAKLKEFADEGRSHGYKIDHLAIVCADGRPGNVLRKVCMANDVQVVEGHHLKRYRWPSLDQIKATYRRLLRKDKQVARKHFATPEEPFHTLREDQEECLASLREHFDSSGAAVTRAQVNVVTGGGKTLTFVRLADDYDSVLVVVPRLLLAQQTYRKFIFQGKRFEHVLFVASKGSRDDLDPSQLRNHTTDPDEIAAFMRKSGRKLVIATYKSSERIKLAKVKFDLAIFDEAHHMAGVKFNGDSPQEAQALLDYRGLRRMTFFTATPRIYSSEVQAKAAAQGHIVASLDDERKFGKVVHNFTYKDALASETPIVKPYEIHLALMSDDGYREQLRQRNIRDKQTRSLESSNHVVAAALQAKIIERHDLRHGIGFTNSIANAKRMRRLFERFVDGHFAATLSSELPVWENQHLRREFEDSDYGYISNVNIYSEGMDSPCVDYIIFADPMQSQSAIAQKVGRGLRYDPNNPDAKLIVIVPVLVDEDDPLGDPRKFKTILEVLGAMAEMDETLKVMLEDIANNKLVGDGLEERFVVDAPDIPLVDIQMVRRMISTAVHSSTHIGWWARFEELSEYVKQHGRVPSVVSGPLGTWANSQRSNYNSTRHRELTQEEIAALESLGNAWYWGRDDIWWARFEELSEYVKQHGRMPPSRSGVLSTWLTSQRSNHNGTGTRELSQDEIAALESLSIDWHRPSTQMTWWERFEELRDYVNQHGCVPGPKASSLGRWANTQRRNYSGTGDRELSEGEIAALESLGDAWWWRQSDIWYTRLQELVEYVDDNGCFPPHKDNSIGVWLVNQRVIHRRGMLSAERIAAFDAALPDGWKGKDEGSKLNPSLPEWWLKRVYCHGDITPSRIVDISWYKQAMKARKLYRDGKMSEAEQARCQSEYPVIWAWLTRPSKSGGDPSEHRDN